MKWCRKSNKRESIRSPEEQRLEKLAELGDQLRLKRQEQGLSLEKITAKTLIPQRLLAAIEEGKLDKLPEPIYIQSFIKQYADALGLNGTELSKNFPTGDRSLRLRRAWVSLPAVQLRPFHLYLLYILVIVGAVNALSEMLSRSTLQSNSQIPQQLFFASTEKQEQVLPKPSEKLKSVTQISKPVQIEITLQAESWIRVVADGKRQFEGFLPKGTQRTWAAQKQLTVRAGNAGGVLVTVNQEKAKQLGNPGEVEEVTFAANSRL